jgi:hypothetical protein
LAAPLLATGGARIRQINGERALRLKLKPEIDV